MNDEIENLRYEFDQRERQEKINTEIYFRLQDLDKLISRIEKLEETNFTPGICFDLEMRLNKIENQNDRFINRIEKLESEDDFKGKRIVDVENRITECILNIDNLWTRLEKLEEVWGQVLNPESYVQLKARLEKLEQKESAS